MARRLTKRFTALEASQLVDLFDEEDFDEDFLSTVASKLGTGAYKPKTLLPVLSNSSSEASTSATELSDDASCHPATVLSPEPVASIFDPVLLTPATSTNAIPAAFTPPPVTPLPTTPITTTWLPEAPIPATSPPSTPAGISLTSFLTPVTPLTWNSQLDNASQEDKENDVPSTPVPSKRSWSNVEAEEPRTPLAEVVKRHKKSTPSGWIRNVNKAKKLRGEAYYTQKMDEEGKWKYVSKSERKRRPRCKKESCSKRSKHCLRFTDEECDEIFSNFWKSGDAGMQNTFIQSLVDEKETARKTLSPSKSSRRGKSKIFRLKKNGEALEVCKEMFLAVLGIAQSRIDSAMKKSTVGISPELKKPRNPHPSRGFPWTDDDQKFLVDFFTAIPKAPSHYCRKDSKKIFLDVAINSFEKLHKAYVAYCQKEIKTPFSIWKLQDYFTKENYSLFQRKKDKCDTCVGHDVGNVTEDVYKEHVKRKNEGFDLKEKDKKSANNKDTFVFTADTEALLIAPLNDANCMFFRTKLNLHNFTFFNLFDKDVMNYLWTEVNGDLEASTFTTCFISQLTDVIEKSPSVKIIILWTDGCVYQNRNNILASALANFAAKHKITVYQKYLEVGHTHMECDSVHKCIETAKKREGQINLPTDYVSLIRRARKKPYGVKYCDYTFFQDFKEICDINSIKPDKKTGPPYVVDIRQLKYTPEGKVFTNITYDDESWTIVPGKNILRQRSPKQTRHAPIKLSFNKWKHLQEICEASLNKDFHWFYQNLDHHPKPT